jgi:predicted esterase
VYTDRMVGSLLASLVVFGQGVQAPGRFEMGERLKELDQVWSSTSDKSRRSLAVPKISKAVLAFFGQHADEGCRSLDEAIAILQGRPVVSEDAVTLRFDPPFVEPRTPAKLRITWAYEPSEKRSVKIQVGKQSIIGLPGRPITVEVRPEQLNPEILQNPEVGFLMPVQVGTDMKSVFLSIIRHPKERLAALEATRQPEAKALVEFLQRAFSDPEELESDFPLIQYLFSAELLDEGRMRVERADSFPLVKYKDTYFRAAFPRNTKGPIDLVIGLHGAGGSENMFFEAYGRGSAVTESMRRSWAFIAPRTSQNAVSDVVEWMKVRRRQRIRRIFILGHSMGGGFALQTGEILPRPAAIALFAPAVKTIPDNLKSVPIFIAVGKQDQMASEVRAFSQLIAGRANCEYLEMDPCEHLMIVGDAIPEAFRFFDQRAGR